MLLELFSSKTLYKYPQPPPPGKTHFITVEVNTAEPMRKTGMHRGGIFHRPEWTQSNHLVEGVTHPNWHLICLFLCAPPVCTYEAPTIYLKEQQGPVVKHMAGILALPPS